MLHFEVALIPLFLLILQLNKVFPWVAMFSIENMVLTFLKVLSELYFGSQSSEPSKVSGFEKSSL